MNAATVRAHLPLALLLLLACVACFLHLNHGALHYDEAIYAQVAKETAQGHHWITLHWNGQPWFDKPPLYFWTTAVLFRLFGPSEVAARALSALAGVGCVTLSYLIATRLFDRTAGMLAGVVLLTSALFVFNARQGMTDVLMTLFLLLVVYSYLKSASDPKAWIVAGIASGLAVLTKGAAGLLAPMIILTTLLVDQRWAELRKRELWLGLSMFVVLAALWHVVLIAIHGRQFIDAYLLRHVIERSASDLHQYNYKPTFYLSALWDFVWPWSMMMPIAVVIAFKRKSCSIVLVNALLPLILFSIARTKFSWYIMPSLPALAILIGFLIRAVLLRVRTPMQHLVWLTISMLSVLGASEAIRHSRPDKEFQAVAELARVASRDSGAISASPESLEMTVLYYSNRRLCADPVVSPRSFGPETKCEPGEIKHLIFENQQRQFIESRLGPIRVLAQFDSVSYGEARSP